MNQSIFRLALIVAASFGLALSASAADWPHWRGPNFNGSSDQTDLPTQFSKTQNVKWAADMPGPAASTPIVFGDRVFVSTTDESARTLHAMALDRKTGKVLWSHQTGDGYDRSGARGDDQPQRSGRFRGRGGGNARANYASISPVTDGKVVVFYYGTGDLVAFDLDGGKLWSRSITEEYGDYAFQWDYSASPTIFEGRLYIQVLQRNQPVRGTGGLGDGRPIDSFLLAIDPMTGKTLWKHVRPSDAVAESLEAYSTPIPFTHEGRSEILIVGGDYITGHDPATGREIWRYGTWNPSKIGHWRLVPSPVAGAGIILASAPKQGPVVAVPAGLSGDFSEKHEVLPWWSERESQVSTDVPTPLFYDGRFYVLSDVFRNLACVEPATGKVIWQVELPGRKRWRASPTGADGKIYCMNHGGDVVIYNAADGKLINNIAMADENEDNIRSSIAVAHGNLFIRTNNKLYCIGD